MIITMEFIDQGRRGAGGFTRRQLELLGLPWPPAKGWKHRVLGQEIDDAAAEEYLALASPPSETQAQRRPTDTPGADVWLYVLELEGGNYYVGISTELQRRLRQHRERKAAVWTSIHPFKRLAYSVNTGTQSMVVAERIEDQATVELMARVGLRQVRGGHFCAQDEAAVEQLLRAQGHWDTIRMAQLRPAASDASDWDQDVKAFIRKVVEYHDGEKTSDLETEVFMAALKLTRSRYWRDDFAAGLSSRFWGAKGVLHVLLTFQLDRPVGSRLAFPAEVLAAALSRGRGGRNPHKWLYLTAWDTFSPSRTPRQDQGLQALMLGDRGEAERDRQYDEFLAVLLPALRHRLR